jgi:hypothetical protein
MSGDSRATVLDVLRDMWREFPDTHTILRNPGTRGRMVELMLQLYRAPAHTLDQCMAEVAKAGYHISEYPPAPPKAAEPAERKLLAPEPISIPTSRHTLAGKLLHAFYMDPGAGMTADEARVAASMSVESGSWKRVSDLRTSGLIAGMEDEQGGLVLRPGDAGVMQQVWVITPYGRSVVAMMED